MKSLFYKSRNIDFKSPNNISFLNDFQKNYILFYMKGFQAMIYINFTLIQIEFLQGN